jgi:hypothetical protein
MEIKAFGATEQTHFVLSNKSFSNDTFLKQADCEERFQANMSQHNILLKKSIFSGDDQIK